MSIWNYVVTAHKPTNATHSCVGNFTAPHELNLIIAKCTRIEIHLLTPQGLQCIRLQPMLDVPIYGRIATLELFRPHGETQDFLFIATERYKFCVLQWDAEASEVITRAMGDVSDRIGRPTDNGQIGIIDPDCRLIGLHLYDGLFKVIPFDNKGQLKEAFNIRLEELQVLDIKFLYGCPKPTIVVLYQDNKDARHVKTYEVSLKDKDFIEGPWAQNNLDNGASLLIPVPPPLCGVLIIGEETIVYCSASAFKAIPIRPSITRAYGRVDADGSRYLLGDHNGLLHLLVITHEKEKVTGLKIELLGETSIASTISYLDNAFVFIGSSYGDSQLVKLNLQPDTKGSYVEVLERYVNLGPIVDFCVVDLERQGQGQVVTCSGAYKDGSLRIVRNGIGINEQAIGNELQYVSFSSETSQFSIRGYFAFIPGGAEGFGQGIKQAKSYYQFAFLENEWVEECRQLCSKVITDAALDISSAIPIFVLKVEAPSDCYGVSRIGKKDRILFKRPEEFRKFLVEFVQNLAATDASQPQNLQKPNCYDVPLHILPNDQPVFNLEEEEQALHDLGCSLMLHPVSSAFPPSLTSQGSDWSAHENLECLGYDLVFQDEHQEAESHVVWSNGDLNFCQACGHMSNVRTTQENTEFEGNDPNSQIQSNYSDADIYPVLETSEANNTLDFVIQDSTQTYADADTKSGEMQHIFFSKESMVMSRKISGTAEQETGTKTPWLCSKPDTYDCADAILDLSQDSTNSEDNVANVNRTGGNGHQKEGKLVQLAVTAKSRDGDNFLPSHHGADVKSNYFDLRTGVQVENSSLRRWLSSKTPPVKHFAAALQVDNVHVLTGDRSVKISKATLAKLQVIRQVDRKFILVQADTSRGKLLLCIDQHAADERVRLESLEEEMFGRDGSLRRVEIYNHGPPLTLRMNFKEREVLLNYGDLIRSWGFAFECVASNPDTIFSIRQEPAAHESSRVLLYATPKVEKRVANAHDFRDFIELLSNAGEIYSHSRIRPPVITRLLHSRACRSAIMFGDRLSIGQCKDLIEELKTCQLPFQCAHGRPSVVPLAEIHSDTLHQ